MRGLIDRRHRPEAAVGGENGDHHRGVGERHQRLAADDAATPAQPFGEGHAKQGAGLPVGGRARRRLGFDAADRKPEVLHPRRKHFAKRAPRFLDIEWPCFRFVLQRRWFLARMVAFPGALAEGRPVPPA
jgi:hypothetical protein